MAEEAAELLRPWLDGAEPELIGEGMEGRVYEIDDERVAKVWFTETADALQRLQQFYDALSAKPLGFAVPRVLELIDNGERRITIERRLVGTSLTERVADGSVARSTAHARVVDIVAGLASSGPLPEGRELSVMNEPEPSYLGTETFPESLARLAQTRRERFASTLEAAVADLDAKTAALVQRLAEVDSDRRTAVHGDLILGNVLVDDDGSPAAVLDWGFFSTEGDPVFDAAVASALFDMYGVDALGNELALHEQFEERLGYSRDAMLVYRAAYSLITANAYTSDGSDGHFAWCAAALNRPDVIRALLG
jgi:Ser/Thr protein kinase RdoA (MazF antagonist)